MRFPDVRHSMSYFGRINVELAACSITVDLARPQPASLLLVAKT